VNASRGTEGTLAAVEPARGPDIAGDTAAIEYLISAAVAAWRTDGSFTEQTVARMSEVATRFARRLAAVGVSRHDGVNADVCRSFIDAPTRTGAEPTAATRHFRRTTIRTVFRTGRNLGLVDRDPTLDIDLPPRSGLPARPLTNDEILLCRTATYTTRASDLRRPTAWALAEATATTAEIPLVRRTHLTPTDTGWRVALPGSRRVDPRTAILTDWGAAVIERRLAELPDDPDTLLAYTGNADERSTARHAAGCALVAAVLSSCALSPEPDIRPSSVRYWRARAHFDNGARIEEVARLLGHRSLDETAEAIGHSWRDS
jgi:integrase/recombinase XerC